MNNKYAKRKYSLFYSALAIMLVLISFVLISSAWFTDTKKINGGLIEPSLDPVITIDGSNKTYSDSFTISSTSDLTKSINFKVSSSVNVKNLLARVQIAVKIGKLSGSTFVEDASITSVILGTKLAYASSWVQGYVPDDIKTLLDANAMNYEGWYYYNSTLSSSSSSMAVVSNFNDYSSVINGGYALQITVVCETAVAGDKLFGEKVDSKYVGGLWTFEDSSIEDIGVATTAWVDSIKQLI